MSKYENAICLFDAYTGHLHAQTLGQGRARMTFARDGKKLAYHSFDFGTRIWGIAGLTAEHRYFTNGYEHMLQGMRGGWVIDQDDEPSF